LNTALDRTAELIVGAAAVFFNPGDFIVTHWIRFRHHDTTGFGTISKSEISIHDGEMFGESKDNGRRLAREPDEPLYLLKAPTSVAAPNAVVKRPASYDGKVVYEGELAIVIGRTCSGVSVDQADAFIHGYTCVNDITAVDVINRDPTFAQWARAKGFDGFCPFGPVIASGIDPAKLVIRTILNGKERQSYPISDMIFSAQELVSRISHDMTLLPGDLICCGTSLGVGSMRDPINKVTVAIDGIGELTNEFRQ
jgi:2-keto-4-pentenoate hydratase/2-oxohepta-3-ene-1,7-dioic acid hydratase in catechol pathway